ncbi:MAG: TetR/AcrR family transcriptional regulator [Alistipes sp.]
MKRGATKEEIIRTTQELIVRNGLYAVRVDEIAQTLGISKRTLYEMFIDKNDLVIACLDDMRIQRQRHIATYRKRRCGSSLQKALKLSNEYIDNLYKVECNFLEDFRRKVTYADLFAKHKAFWLNELALIFDTCREDHLLLQEIDAASFADRIMNTLFELRINGTTREEMYLFCRTLLRGAASQQGIELLDGKR